MLYMFSPLLVINKNQLIKKSIETGKNFTQHKLSKCMHRWNWAEFCIFLLSIVKGKCKENKKSNVCTELSYYMYMYTSYVSGIKQGVCI